MAVPVAQAELRGDSAHCPSRDYDAAVPSFLSARKPSAQLADKPEVPSDAARSHAVCPTK